jgi:hypothetical protein
MYEGPGQKYGEYRAPYEYGHCKVLKTPVAGYPRRFIHMRDKAPITSSSSSSSSNLRPRDLLKGIGTC